MKEELKEQLISFETAKLAKNNGFDIEQRYYYDKGGETWSFHTWTEGLPYPEASFAPTQALLQTWLRSNYPNLSLHCIPNETDNEGWHYTFWNPKGNSLNPSNDWVLSDYYSSYEEALEAGLYEALKVIA